MKKIILTGDRPTGKLHLGHYLGTLKNRVELQDDYECYIIVADLHMLTTKIEKLDSLKESINDLVLDYLSVGLDPTKVTIYIQSQIPEVTELYMIFSMLVSVPRLQRVPTLKDVMADLHIENPSLGLLSYPVLQAADILMVRANLVPVGKDQASHIEVTREIAQKFNNTFKEVFPIPEALIPKENGTLPGIDGKLKMSKSLDNAIYLSDNPQVVKQRVMQMYTDPTRIKATDPGHIEGNPVFTYLDAFGTEENKAKINEYKERYQKGEVGDIEVKEFLIKILNSFLEPIRAKRAEFEKEAGLVEKILSQGTTKAQAEAQKTLKLAKEAMGLP